ncbi:MAG: class I tRNA ligase family protein, partial [Solirubrobacteraceae bacterium]
GRRMSKSLGTGIDPLDLIEGGPRPPVFAQKGKPAGEFPAYGADAVRWGLLAMSSGQDVSFSEDKVSQGQQLTNKLFNAARLILLGIGEIGGEVSPAPVAATIEDRWILSRLGNARAELAERLGRYDFAHAALGLYDFVYGELCDWYLELIKPRLRAGERELAQTLLHVLIETVTLAHPLIPFVTEEIWALIPGAQGLLAQRAVPAAAEPSDAEAERAIGRAIEAIQELRRWRDLTGVPAGAVLSARLQADGYEHTHAHLARLARLSLDGADSAAAPAERGRTGEPAPQATVAISGGRVLILDGVDTEGARARLQERRRRLESEIERAERKLANQGFVAKAPAEVVQTERDKLEALRAELTGIMGSL